MPFISRAQESIKKSIFLLLLIVLASTTSSLALVQITSAIFILLCLGLTLRQIFKKNDYFLTIRKTGLEKFILIFFISGFISNIFIEDSFSMKLRNLYDFTWILFFYFATFSIDKMERNQIKKGIKILSYICLIIGFFSVLQYGFGTNFIRESYENRITGLMGNPIPYGNTIAILISFFIPFLFQNIEKKSKKILVITVCSLAFVLLFTYTRGAWLGAFFGALVALYFSTSKRKFLIYAVSIVLFFLLFFTFNTNIKDRTMDTGVDFSSSQRIQLWNVYYDVFKENPVFGVGLFPRHKSFPKIHEKHKLQPRTSSPHNNLLKILSSMGIIGFIPCVVLFLSFLAFPLRAILYSELEPFSRSILIGSIGSQVSFHISGLTSTNYLEMTTRTLLILILALSFSVMYKSKN